MIQKCADAAAGWLIRCDAAAEEDRELYAYAIHSFLLSFSPLLLSLALGIGMGCVWQSLLVTFPFMVIRKFSGGYHAKHSGVCLFSSCLLLYLCIRLSLSITQGQALACIAAGASASLIHFSPIDNKNRRLSTEEHRCYKKVTFFLVAAFLLLDILCLTFHLDACSICISISILLTAGLQPPCIAKKLLPHIEAFQK